MIKKIILAGGCFWGLEDLIRKQPGVVNTQDLLWQLLFCRVDRFKVIFYFHYILI